MSPLLIHMLTYINKKYSATLLIILIVYIVSMHAIKWILVTKETYTVPTDPYACQICLFIYAMHIICVCTYVHACICMCLAYVCVCLSVCLCVCVCIHAWVCVCMSYHVCMYVCMGMCMNGQRICKFDHIV